MIVAGIGCRKGVAVEEVVAAIDHALLEIGLTRAGLSALATTAFKRDEAAIFEAGRALELPVKVIGGPATGEPAALGCGTEATVDTLTRSSRSLALAGSPSVSEAAALGAAGPGGRLLGPRIILGSVTCAIAVGAEP